MTVIDVWIEQADPGERLEALLESAPNFGDVQGVWSKAGSYYQRSIACLQRLWEVSLSKEAYRSIFTPSQLAV